MMNFFNTVFNKIGIYVEFLVYMVVGLVKSAVHLFGMVLELIFFYLIPAYLIFFVGVWAIWFFLVKKQEQQGLKKFFKTNKWLRYSFYSLTFLLVVLASWKENYLSALYYYIKSIF